MENKKYAFTAETCQQIANANQSIYHSVQYTDRQLELYCFVPRIFCMHSFWKLRAQTPSMDHLLISMFRSYPYLSCWYYYLCKCWKNEKKLFYDNKFPFSAVSIICCVNNRVVPMFGKYCITVWWDKVFLHCPTVAQGIGNVTNGHTPLLTGDLIMEEDDLEHTYSIV